MGRLIGKMRAVVLDSDDGKLKVEAWKRIGSDGAACHSSLCAVHIRPRISAATKGRCQSMNRSWRGAQRGAVPTDLDPAHNRTSVTAITAISQVDVSLVRPLATYRNRIVY